MTTYTFSGFIMGYDEFDDPVYQSTTELSLVFSEGASTITTYSVVGTPLPNELPFVDVNSEASDVIVDGISLNENPYFSQSFFEPSPRSLPKPSRRFT